MGAAEVLVQIQAAGVRLTAVGEHLHAEPRPALTDETRVLIRARKAALLAHLAAEARRQAVLAMLDAKPGIRYAVQVDDADADPVILALAIRDIGTCELAIPQAGYYGFEVLKLIEHYTTPE